VDGSRGSVVAVVDGGRWSEVRVGGCAGRGRRTVDGGRSRRSEVCGRRSVVGSLWLQVAVGGRRRRGSSDAQGPVWSGAGMRVCTYAHMQVCVLAVWTSGCLDV